jgi:hypothetical protein
MNGFSAIPGCEQSTNYQCYRTFDPSSIAVENVIDLASTFVVSDRTFETDSVASWGSHMELVSSHLDGFYSAHVRAAEQGVVGHGCDSGDTAAWWATYPDFLTAESNDQPSCIPAPDGTGPFEVSAVPWTDNILNRYDEAGVSWNLYTPAFNEGGYGWAICPTFAECLNGPQAQKMVRPEQFAVDALAGDLPSVSYLLPRSTDSQHNGRIMSKGDDWIATNVQAVMDGPDWDKTAIFLTWDDCGCFYDHVPPPPHLGIRVPMIIISPFAKPAFTDSNVAGYISMMAFIEHTFGLAPLSIDDATAYDYSDSFNFTQSPLPRIQLRVHGSPASALAWEAAQPDDSDDPT